MGFKGFKGILEFRDPRVLSDCKASSDCKAKLDCKGLPVYREISAFKDCKDLKAKLEPKVFRATPAYKVPSVFKG